MCSQKKVVLPHRCSGETFARPSLPPSSSKVWPSVVRTKHLDWLWLNLRLDYDLTSYQHSSEIGTGERFGRLRVILYGNFEPQAIHDGEETIVGRWWLTRLGVRVRLLFCADNTLPN